MQPTILPSNAAETHPDIPLRVLQEYSHNRQTNTPASFHDLNVKHHTSTAAIENVWTSTQPTITPLYIPQLPRYPAFNTRSVAVPHPRGGPLTYAEEEYEIQKAKKLQARWREFEGYTKYRDGTGKGKKATQETKWPEHVEMAFIRALVRHHPRGRSQVRYKDKAQGRNESIAATIQELVGGPMGRKQVSSHIQVLKKWFKEDRYIMSFFDEADSLTRQKNKRSAQRAAETRSRAAHATMAAETVADMFPLHVFQPTDFSMFIQEKYLDADNQEIRYKTLHTYSRHVDRHATTIKEEPIINWHGKYPQLAYLLGDVTPDCNVLVGNVSIRLPQVKYSGDNIELGVSLTCSSNALYDVIKSKSRLRFIGFEDVIQQINPGSSGPFVQEDAVVWDPSDKDRPHVYDTHLRFGSGHWAKCLSKLPGLLPHRAQTAREYLGRLSILQEIFTEQEEETGPMIKQRILIIYWQFSLAEERGGATDWRRLKFLDCTKATSNVVATSSEYIKKSFEEMDEDAIPEYTYNTSGYQYERASEVIPRQPSLQSPFEYDCHSAASSASTVTWPSTSTNVDSAAAISSFADTIPEVGQTFHFDTTAVDMANFDFSEFDAAGTTFDIQISGDFGEEFAAEDAESADNHRHVWSYPPTYHAQGSGQSSTVPIQYEGQGRWNEQAQLYQDRQHAQAYQQQHDDESATYGASIEHVQVSSRISPVQTLQTSQYPYAEVNHGMILPAYTETQSVYKAGTSPASQTSQHPSPHDGYEAQAYGGATGSRRIHVAHNGEVEAEEGASALAVLAGATSYAAGLPRVEELSDTPQ